MRIAVTEHPTTVWLSRQVTQASRGTRFRAFCYATVTHRMARPSDAGSKQWGSRR
jgi:hypothetical protein